MIISGRAVDPAWRGEVAKWVVESGALSVMTWGQDCEEWHDDVDHMLLSEFDYAEVPDERFIMTSWHDGEPLRDVFFFARLCAFHPTIDLPILTIVDVTEKARSAAILGLYEAEAADLLEDTYVEPSDWPLVKRFKLLLGKK
jgi:hypothetical protein